MKIVTLTMNPAIDQSALVDRVVPDRKLRCKPPTFEPGGGGINVSRAIQRLGGESLAIYPAGGSMGEFIEEMLNSQKLNHDVVKIDGRTRQNLMVYEESTDQQYRFGMPGPRLNKNEWRQCLKATLKVKPKPEYVIASGSLPDGVPEDFYARLADLCKENGVNLIVDTSGEPLRRAAKADVFLIKPNLRELKYLEKSNWRRNLSRKPLCSRLWKSDTAAMSLYHSGQPVSWQPAKKAVSDCGLRPLRSGARSVRATAW
jgi:6-phosphofructokinase 2